MSVLNLNTKGGLVQVSLEGADELTALLKQMDPKVRAECRGALKTIVQSLKGASQRLAPIDTGDLRGSAYATTRDKSTGLEGEVGYPLPYAVRQHEEVGYRHPKGGQAKYLEEPFKAGIARYTEYFRDAVKKATGAT